MTQKKLHELTPVELFNEIEATKEKYDKSGRYNDEFVRFNFSDHNMRIDRNRFDEDKDYFIKMDIDQDGNSFREPQNFVDHMAAILKFGRFTKDEIMTILENSKCMAFWKDLHEIDDFVGELFGKIYKFNKDFHLEFWQGALSNLGAELSKENVLAMVNSDQNGDKYCETMYEIYKALHKIVVDYGFAGQYTLMSCFGPCVY